MIADQGCPPPYHLQFHGRDNRLLKEAYARIFGERLPDAGFDRWWLRGGKPRVGFVVTDGHEGVFLRYLRGVFERIDRREFEPVVICSAGGEQRLRTQVPAEAFETFVIPSRFDRIVERIREGRFAVLYHWEIGSDVTNYFLPFFRLAPVQCTGAGLPDTSGIPQVNYFLSSAVCEAPRAERTYTERLILSPSSAHLAVANDRRGQMLASRTIRASAISNTSICARTRSRNFIRISTACWVTSSAAILGGRSSFHKIVTDTRPASCKIGSSSACRTSPIAFVLFPTSRSRDTSV